MITIVGSGELASVIRVLTNKRCIQRSAIWLAEEVESDATGTTAERTIPICLDTAKTGTVVLISTAVPVGYARAVALRFPHVHVVSVPNLAPRGQYSTFFFQRDLIVGTDDPLNKQRLRDIFQEEDHRRCRFVSLNDAEMIKHAQNIFLGMSIVYANELDRLSSKLGARYEVIEHVLREDPRIGKHAYIRAGSADGSHFLRDMKVVRDTSGDDSPLLSTLISSWS